MKKILSFIVFLLTLCPILDITDASMVSAQSATYENGSFWLPNLGVSSTNEKCDKCNHYYDPEEEHICTFKCDYCDGSFENLNDHYRNTYSCGIAAGYDYGNNNNNNNNGEGNNNGDNNNQTSNNSNYSDTNNKTESHSSGETSENAYVNTTNNIKTGYSELKPYVTITRKGDGTISMLVRYRGTINRYLPEIVVQGGVAQNKLDFVNQFIAPVKIQAVSIDYINIFDAPDVVIDVDVPETKQELPDQELRKLYYDVLSALDMSNNVDIPYVPSNSYNTDVSLDGVYESIGMQAYEKMISDFESGNFQTYEVSIESADAINLDPLNRISNVMLGEGVVDFAVGMLKKMRKLNPSNIYTAFEQSLSIAGVGVSISHTVMLIVNAQRTGKAFTTGECFSIASDVFTGVGVCLNLFGGEVVGVPLTATGLVLGIISNFVSQSTVAIPLKDGNYLVLNRVPNKQSIL